MTYMKMLCSTAALALVTANAALAEVTPEQVWENWKSLSTAYGQTVSSTSAAREGDVLVVRGLNVTSKNADAEATVTIEQLNFADKGDGTVDVTMSETSNMVIRTAAVEDVPATTTTLDVLTPGLLVNASGTAEEMRYQFSGPTVTMRLAGIDAPDAPTDLKVEGVISGMSGDYLISGAADKTIASTFKADGLSVVVAGTNTEDGSKIDAKIDFAGLSGQSNTDTRGDMSDMAAALKAGAAISGSFAYQSASMDVKATDATGTTSLTGINAGGDLNFAMDAMRLAYGGTAREASMTASGPQIPFPQLNLAYKEGAFNLVMPVSKSDTPADFGLLLKLVDLTVSNEVWDMLDPGKQLPRDPVSVVLDASGKVKLLVDLMDETAMTNMAGTPGELHALTLNALQVKAAGAEITGDGALTFDNTDLTTFSGVPAPTGNVNLKAVGLNGLLDKLMAMGLIPEDQMMGARMMLGMFAKVVEGEPDTMTSAVEFKDKHLFVNGMQLQ
jgi:hypothetical protein